MSSSNTAAASSSEDNKPSQTYECGCHCGYIKFSMTLSPPLLTGSPETSYKVLECNCSACARFGYLLVYPEAADVTWHHGGRERCANYRFNTKAKDQMFCPRCGASVGIDFREVRAPHTYGISARTVYGLKPAELTLRKLDGMDRVPPAGDLSGHWWDEEKQEMK